LNSEKTFGAGRVSRSVGQLPTGGKVVKPTKPASSPVANTIR
jgi:hypothetical protein